MIAKDLHTSAHSSLNADFLFLPGNRSLPAPITELLVPLPQFWQEHGRDSSGAQIIRMVGKYLPGQTAVTAMSPQVVCEASSLVFSD